MKQSKRRLVRRIHGDQLSSSRKRHHAKPTYSLDEIYNWCMSQHVFHDLYDLWVLSGLEKDMRPSLDRKDDSIGYSFSNIRICTWYENRMKQAHRVKSGDSRTCKIVEQYSLDGIFIKSFVSGRAAGRITGVPRSSISHCCIGNCSNAGGFIWRYK